MKLNRRQITILFLAAVGIVICFLLYPRSVALNPGVPAKKGEFEDDAWIERILLALAAILTLVPFSRRALARFLDKLRSPSSTTRRWTSVAIFVFSQPLLYGMAVMRGRVLLPYWHDENFYRLQTTFLAHGKLWTAAHPLPDFFDVPYVFVKPVYAVAYFPGTAMLHVPAVWLHLPYFVTPLLIAGVSLALIYLIATELIDGIAGLLAVLLMISLVLFRWMALIEMSHAAGAMWGLVAFWSWLSWRRTKGMRWVVLASVAAGFYAITRPFDCALVLFPIAMAWAWDLRSIAWRTRGAMLIVALIIVTPFIALQLAFDRAVTGHLFQTPMGLYYRTYMNLHGLGLEHYDPAFVPPTRSKLIQDTYQGIVASRMREFSSTSHAAWLWIDQRLPISFGTSLPTLLLIVLIPIAFIQLRDRRTQVLWGAFWCYMIGSAFVFQFLDHYVMAIAPMVIILTLAGAKSIERAFPARQVAMVFLPVAIFLLALHRICLNDQGAYQDLRPGVMHANYIEIPAKVVQPAIVLFKYSSAERPGAFNEEPVYNWDVVNPDDAPIIRAHDLGDTSNLDLFEYYARKQPNRHVYTYDRATATLRSLGAVKHLRGMPQEGLTGNSSGE